MRTIILKQKFAPAAVLSAGIGMALASCIASDVPVNTRVEQWGDVSISRPGVVEDVREKNHGHHTPPVFTRAEAPVADDFDLTVESLADGSTVFAGKVNEVMDTPLHLPVGDYSLKIESHAHTAAEWDRVHYSVSQAFEIEKDKMTYLNELVCKVSSILVSVRFDEDMQERMDDDCEVEISIGNCGPLVYTADHEKRGNFVAELESNTLVWDFSGTILGSGEQEDEWLHQGGIIEGVKAGEHRTLTFGTEVVEAGEGTFTLTVSPECEIYNINLNVLVEQPIVEPFPEDPEPGDDAVAITGDGIESPLDITAAQAGSVPVVVNIAAPEGIAELLVEIETTNPGFGEAAAALGVLNITEPGESQDMLDMLGLPYGAAVKGQTSLTFPITSFVPMIFMTAGGDPDFTVDFKITVTDSEGASKTETVKLHLTQE